MSVPEIEVFGRYRNALLAAVKGDRRSLVRQLKAGVPLTRADMSMLADLIAGRFKPLATKPAHRPARTQHAFRNSDDPADLATMHFWLEADRLKARGEAYGRLGQLSDQIAALYRLDAAKFPEIRKRRRRFKPARNGVDNS